MRVAHIFLSFGFATHEEWVCGRRREWGVRVRVRGSGGGWRREVGLVRVAHLLPSGFCR